MNPESQQSFSPDTRERAGRPPYPASSTLQGEGIPLFELLSMLYRSRLFIAGISFLAVLGSVLYVLFAPPVYKVQARVFVQPDYGERALASLRSVSLLEQIVHERELLPWIFDRKWDDRQEKWLVDDADVPSLRLGGLYLRRHLDVDVRGQFATIGFRTCDPAQGVEIVGDLIKKANVQLVDRIVDQARSRIQSLVRALDEYDSLLVKALVSASKNVSSGSGRVQSPNDERVRDIAGVLEENMKSTRSYEERSALIVEVQEHRALISQAEILRSEFALMVVEKPAVPERKEKIWPKGIVLIPAGFLGGLFISIAFVLVRGVAGRIPRVPE